MSNRDAGWAPFESTPRVRWVSLPLQPSACLLACLLVCSFVRLFVCLFVCVFVCLCVCLFAGAARAVPRVEADAAAARVPRRLRQDVHHRHGEYFEYPVSTL